MFNAANFTKEDILLSSGHIVLCGYIQTTIICTGLMQECFCVSGWKLCHIETANSVGPWQVTHLPPGKGDL